MRTPISAVLRSAALAGVAALAMTSGVGIASAQPAGDALPIPRIFSAPTQGAKQLVAFGDSFTANAGKSGPRGLEPGQTPFVANCATDMENWPKIAGVQLGKSVGDWSCNGTGGLPVVQLLAYLEAAIQYGDIAPGTEDVVVMYGGMDALQWVDVAGELIPAGEDQINPTVFRDTMKRFADRVHAVAPDARVTLASYPEYATDDKMCLFNTVGQVNPIPAPKATRIQEALRDSIKDAADFSGASFIDVYEATKGHGTCNPDDSQRYVAGFVDPAIGPMTNHPTVAGEHAMGGIIAGALK